jgi:RND family efflux transporter MFP subunit
MNSTLAKLNSWLIQTKAQVDATKWQNDLARIALNNSVIKAPFSSTVVSKLVEVWSLVNPWTPVYSLVSSDKIKIKVDVSAENIKSIKKWQTVELKLINSNSAIWTINLVAKNADPKTNLFTVEIKFDNKILKAKIGEFVNIYIDKTIWEKDWIMIPFESIINVSDWVYNVFVINWSGSVVSREVKLWVKNSENVEVLSWLKEWEKIAVSKVGDLEDGDLVKDK